MLGFSYSILKNNKENLNNNLNSTLSDINAFQKYYKDAIANKTDNNIKQETLFDNGLNLLLTGYDTFTKAEKFTARISGEIIADASIVKYKIILRCYITKTPEQIESIINMYCAENPKFNSSSKSVLVGNSILEYETDKLVFQNDELIADFTGCTAEEYTTENYKNNHGTLPGQLFYTVNGKTVTAADNFYVKKDIAGNIISYNTNFTLSPTTSTTDYIKLLLTSIEGSKDFNFTLTSGSIVADKEGKITTLYTKDDYTFYYNLFGNAFWKVNCKSNLVFNIQYN